MSAGAKGDHPLNDILLHKLKVYNEKCDKLIEEISKLKSRQEMFELFDWFDEKRKLQLDIFEKDLAGILKKLKQEMNSRGYEIRRNDSE